MSRVNGLVLLQFGWCAPLGATPALTGRPRWPPVKANAHPTGRRTVLITSGQVASRRTGGVGQPRPGGPGAAAPYPGGTGKSNGLSKLRSRLRRRLLCRP